jgi:ribosomal 30S subunit maturation factor RimM
VLLEKGGESRFFHVESTWQHNGRPILKLAGIDSMTAAEELAGSELLVEESEQLRPAEGEYSHAELAGCEGLERAGSSGRGSRSRGIRRSAALASGSGRRP